MKINQVITASDLTKHYIQLLPMVDRLWSQMGLKCYFILVAPEIPENLKVYQDRIILFRPLPGVHTSYIAQVIRILYPCLLPGSTLTTDIDIFPISHKYYVQSIGKIPEDHFVTYTDRYISQKMLAICYNVAHQNTWQEIFRINSIEDIIQKLVSWYNVNYNGTKNCPGWFTDQQKLYEHVINWSGYPARVTILNDLAIGFSRLDKRKSKYICTHMDEILENIRLGRYTDFHCIKPYYKYQDTVDQIFRTINNFIRQSYVSYDINL